jgi:hypothetical protein
MTMHIQVDASVMWQDNWQLTVSFASFEFDPNAEVLFWLETVRLYRQEYAAAPYVV